MGRRCRHESIRVLQGESSDSAAVQDMSNRPGQFSRSGGLRHKSVRSNQARGRRGFVDAEEYNLCIGRNLTDSFGRIKAAQGGHRQVENDYVRGQFPHFLKCLCPIPRLAADIPLVVVSK